MDLNTASRFRGERLFTLFAVLLMACAGTPHGRSKDEWASARTIAEHYLRDKYGTSWKITAEDHGLPFMFDVEVADAAVVLVHDNAVFTQRGMAGLDAYLRGSRCVEQRLPSVDDMIVLLTFLDAWPPDSKPRGYFGPDSLHEQWRPHLDYLDGGSAQLRLMYRIWEITNNDRMGGGEARSSGGALREWTLKMDPGQMPVWTSETRWWDDDKGQWRVDHTN